MFGIANQLLAAIALSVGTVILVKTGKARYAWVTVLPMSFVVVTTFSAAWQMFPKLIPLNKALIGVMALCSIFVFGGAFQCIINNNQAQKEIKI